MVRNTKTELLCFGSFENYRTTTATKQAPNEMQIKK
jgi:hypothetical protein